MKNIIISKLLGFAIFVSAFGQLFAQEEMNPSDGFATGAESFPAKPLDMWELGIHAGALYIDSDLISAWPGGYGVGLHLRKALGYTVSLRGDLMFGNVQGIENRRWGSPAGRNRVLSDLGYGEEGREFVRNYQMKMFSGNLQILVNVGNILFHQPDPSWNFYALGGLGVYGYNTRYDALDENGALYDFSSVDFESEDVRKQVKEILDGDFETEGYSTDVILALNNSNNIVIDAQAGAGISRKINDRFNISLEYIIMISNTDYLDGYTFRTAVDRSTSDDIIHYANLRFNINLGSFERRVEPLYWVNPLKTTYNDIAALKRRPKLDLTDEDNDGVLDMFDEDTETPEGVAVDVQGRALDTDNDGIPDYKDQELFSPQGYEVNESGVAQVDDPYLTKSEIEAMVDGKISSVKMDWWLPMINFGLDEYAVEPQMVPALSQIATVVRSNPNIKIVVKGYADNRADEAYNDVLSYKRAASAINFLVERFDLSRDKFIIQYAGENNPIIRDLPEKSKLPAQVEEQHSLNRRVEFTVAGPNDQPMPKPEGPDAGEEPKVGGPDYKGHKNIGY